MRNAELIASAVVALGAATGSMLAPQAASAAAALSFDFSFPGGVTGIIEGLLEGQITAPERITVLTPMLYADEYSRSLLDGGVGFGVSNGVIISADWSGKGQKGLLRFFGGPPECGEVGSLCAEVISSVVTDGARGFVTFSSRSIEHPSAVPGPLPLLGVAAAFGFSRKLRKRIKSSKLPVVSAID